jgi:hypothetical protein
MASDDEHIEIAVAHALRLAGADPISRETTARCAIDAYKAGADLVPRSDLDELQAERDDMEKRINNDFRLLRERHDEIERLRGTLDELLVWGQCSLSGV